MKKSFFHITDHAAVSHIPTRKDKLHINDRLNNPTTSERARQFLHSHEQDSEISSFDKRLKQFLCAIYAEQQDDRERMATLLDDFRDTLSDAMRLPHGTPEQNLYAVLLHLIRICQDDYEERCNRRSMFYYRTYARRCKDSDILLTEKSGK